jgi:hypothetical protein
MVNENPTPILDTTKLKKPQRKTNFHIAALTGMINAFKELCNFPLKKDMFQPKDLWGLQLYKRTNAVWNTHRHRVDEAFADARPNHINFPHFNRKRWEDYTPALAYDVQHWLKDVIPLLKKLKKDSKKLNEEIEFQHWVHATNNILHKGKDYKRTLEELDKYLEKERLKKEKNKANHERKFTGQQSLTLTTNQPRKRRDIENKLTNFWKEVHRERTKPKEWELPQDWETLTQNEIQAQKGKNAHRLTEPITMEFLTFWILNKLKLKTSPGKDKIPNEVYKFLFTSNKDDKLEMNFQKIRQHMLNVFNYLLQGYALPKDWHIAHITCAFKGGDINDPAHYRPIALLINLYKIYSGIITFRLSNYTEENKLISEAQAGSRPRHGTHELISALISIMDAAIATHSALYILFIDIKKAYNSVPHWALLQRLKSIGCTEEFLLVIKNIYANADSFIKVNGIITDISFKEQRGVRQGDPLSPLLLIIFLDPLIRYIRAETKKSLKSIDFNCFIGGKQMKGLFNLVVFPLFLVAWFVIELKLQSYCH